MVNPIVESLMFAEYLLSAEGAVPPLQQKNAFTSPCCRSLPQARRPPNPGTVGKLSLSAFQRYLVWGVSEQTLTSASRSREATPRRGAAAPSGWALKRYT